MVFKRAVDTHQLLVQTLICASLIYTTTHSVHRLHPVLLLNGIDLNLTLQNLNAPEWLQIMYLKSTLSK